MKLNVLFEDNHLLALEKPAGSLVHGDQTGDEPLLEEARDYIKRKYKKPGAVYLQPVHRIDRPVSGVVLFGRTSKAVDRLVKQFTKGEVQKTYLAVVDGIPDKPSRVITNFLGKNKRLNKAYVTGKDHKGSRFAKTSYTHIATMGNRSLLAVRPHTGRPHQIRVHLSHAGFPIVGDVKYDGSTHENPRSILLHHVHMQIEHPTLRTPLEFSTFPKGSGGWNHFRDWFNKESLKEMVGKLNELS